MSLRYSDLNTSWLYTGSSRFPWGLSLDCIHAMIEMHSIAQVRFISVIEPQHVTYPCSGQCTFSGKSR